MAILTARITVRGTRPLFWHRFGPDALPIGGGNEKPPGVPGNNPEEWKKTYLATPDGQLYVEASYIFGCLRDGARHTKKGRGSIQSTVSATLQVTDNRVLIDRFFPAELTTDDTQPVYLDVRGVRNPATKGRNVRYRVAASTGWETTFNIMWDATLISRNEMRLSLSTQDSTPVSAMVALSASVALK